MPTLPQLVTPPGPQILPNTMLMTPGLMNLAVLRESSPLSHSSPWQTTMAHNKHAIKSQPIDFEKLRTYFGWVNKHTIEKTFNKTTQWAVASTMYPMRKHFMSRFPAFNIPRRSEEIATDTIFSDTPAIDSGVTMAQLFVGKRTLVTDVYPSNPKTNLSTH